MLSREDMADIMSVMREDSFNRRYRATRAFMQSIVVSPSNRSHAVAEGRFQGCAFAVCFFLTLIVHAYACNRLNGRLLGICSPQSVPEFCSPSCKACHVVMTVATIYRQTSSDFSHPFSALFTSIASFLHLLSACYIQALHASFIYLLQTRRLDEYI